MYNYWLDKKEGVLIAYSVESVPLIITDGLIYLGKHESNWYPTEEQLNHYFD